MEEQCSANLLFKTKVTVNFLLGVLTTLPGEMSAPCQKIVLKVAASYMFLPFKSILSLIFIYILKSKTDKIAYICGYSFFIYRFIKNIIPQRQNGGSHLFSLKNCKRLIFENFLKRISKLELESIDFSWQYVFIRCTQIFKVMY